MPSGYREWKLWIVLVIGVVAGLAIGQIQNVCRLNHTDVKEYLNQNPQVLELERGEYY